MGNIDFNELFKTYSRRLHGLAFSYTRDPFLAEDVVQETFIKAYKKLDTIVDSTKIGAWLSAITARTAIDLLRMEKRKCSRLIVSPDSIVGLSSPDKNPEDEVEMLLLNEELSNRMNQLSKDYYDVLCLKIIFGLNEKEIAKRLRLKPSTVKTRLYRARKQLKQFYQKEIA
nr:RNA polymerase sigma factor [Neobacillus sp. Marseille-Q6967]